MAFLDAEGRPIPRTYSPAPAAKKAAPKRRAIPSGPVQPAFPPETYLQENPWSRLELAPAKLRDYVPEKPEPPMQMADTRIASSTLDEPSPMSAPVPTYEDEVLKPMLGTGMLRRISIGNRPGEKGESQLQADQDKSMSRERTKFMDPGQFISLEQASESTPPMQAIKAEMERRDLLNKHIADTLPTGQMNIAPLLGLVDDWYGTSLAKNYRAPSSAEDRAKLLTGFADNKYKALHDYGDANFKNIAYMKEGTDQDKLVSKLAEKMGYSNENFKPPAPLRGRNDRGSAIDDYKIIQEGAKISKEALDKISSLDSAEQLLASGDIGSIKRSLSVIARAVSGEKGVLTDQDITRVLPATLNMDANTFAAYVTSNPNLLADKKIVDALIRDVRSARTRITQNADEKINNFEGSLIASPNFRGKPVREMLQPFRESIKGKQTSPLQTNDEKATTEFRNNFLKLLEQNKKGIK